MFRIKERNKKHNSLKYAFGNMKRIGGPESPR